MVAVKGHALGWQLAKRRGFRGSRADRMNEMHGRLGFEILDYYRLR
jgi:hypothetical protein